MRSVIYKRNHPKRRYPNEMSGLGYTALSLEDKVADQATEIRAVSATVYRLKAYLKDQGES
jgi:hypothetical protein